jgi:signal transduction histidine kinase
MVLIFLFVFTAEHIFHAFNQPHLRYKLAFLLRPFAIFDYIILLTVYLAFDAWVEYISGPSRKNFDPLNPQFEKITVLAGEFQNFLFFMSMLVLFAAVRLAEYMVLVDELANIYVSVANAVGDMAWFLVFFCLLFGGFVLSGHVLFGTDLPMFGSLESTASNLSLWLLALGGGYRDLFEKPGGMLYLVLFLFICLILILNILMALILVAFNPEEKAALKVMKFEEEDRPFNHRAAEYLCDLFKVSPFHGDLYKGHSMESDEDGDGTYDDADVEKAPLIARPTQEEDSEDEESSKDESAR